MTTPSEGPSPDLFFDTVQAYQRTAALRAAIELRLFTAIGDGASSVAQIAGACRTSVRGTRILCDFLTIYGFLTKHGDTYQLTPDSSVFLTTRSPAYLGGIVEFMCSPEIIRNFDGLADTVRAGTVPPAANTVADENPVWETFARAMVPMMMPSAQAIVDVLGLDRAGAIRVLDIAAGHGMFGVVIAQRNPQAEVVAVDWKGVLEVASDHARQMGVADRHRTIPGDAFKVEWGDGFDLALLTNFLHHFDPPTCTSLLAKVGRSLKPGGRVAILEFVPNEDRVTPPMPASFAMQMLAGTEAGDAYTFRELREMLETTGFTAVAAHGLQGPQTLVVGTRA
jgi:ubiquinone/menaquinone biosynthesis C-methylase UbiE